MRVHELMSTSHLRLRLVAGATGLQRIIEWAHVSELEDPTPWLEGSELLMTTGMGVPPEPVRQVAYVERLIRRGVAALAINADMFAPALASEMILEADSSGFPIIEVPVDVNFELISRVVFAESLPESGPARLLQILYAIRAHLAKDSHPADLFQSLEGIARCQLYGISEIGQQLHPNLPLPPADLDIQSPISADRLPSLPNGFVVPIHLAGRFVGHLVATEGKTGGESGLRTVQLIATVVAQEIAGLRDQSRIRCQEGGETLRELLTGALAEEAALRRLALAGFQAASPFIVLAIDFVGASTDSDLRDAWQASGIPFLLFREDVSHAIVPADSQATEVLALVGERVHAGASGPLTSPGGIAVARQEANWALQRARAMDLPYVCFSQGDTYATWLPADPVLLGQISDRILGPVIAYDRDRGTNLLETLRVWLDSNRSLEGAASALSIHKHTLAYRLKRVEALTGKRLSQLPDLVDCWLAVQAIATALPPAE